MSFDVRVPTLSIVGCTTTFYALDWLDSLLERREKTSYALLRLADQVKAFRWDFERKFARAIFDYFALVCFGESRWSWYESWGGFRPTCFRDWSREKMRHRDLAYVKALQFDPWDFLPKLETIFLHNDWAPEYGGKLWAKLAEHAQNFGTQENRLFIDVGIALQHNTGSPFDKNVIFHPASVLNEILEEIKTERPEDWLQHYSISKGACRLFTRAKLLGLQVPETQRRVIGEFPEVEWGKKTLELTKGPD